VPALRRTANGPQSAAQRCRESAVTTNETTGYRRCPDKRPDNAAARALDRRNSAIQNTDVARWVCFAVIVGHAGEPFEAMMATGCGLRDALALALASGAPDCSGAEWDQTRLWS
jgi:hypothetical protein